MVRAYDNSKREQKSAETARRILAAAEAFVREKPLGELTLADVAERSECTVQTIIRKYGGKEGLLEAVSEEVRARIIKQRSQMLEGDIDAAMDNLLEHYETEGDLVLRLLAQESTSDFAAEMAAEGRVFHRGWVESTFGPVCGPLDSTQIDALVVATDLFTWRLLRRDLARSLAETKAVLIQLIDTFKKKVDC